MPPKCKFTKKEIVDASLKLVRENGIDAVTARAVAAELNSSSKVIFSLFQNMEELQGEVIKTAYDLYQSFLTEEMSSGKYPPYKGSGMAYIRFARDEKELFKLLFMRDRTNEKTMDDSEDIKPILGIIQENLGLSEADAREFHLEMWIYVHGIATMLATNYLELDWDIIDSILSKQYNRMKDNYGKQGLVKDGSN